MTTEAENLRYALMVGSFDRLGDEAIDVDDATIEDPVADRLAKTAFAAAMQKSTWDWDEQIGSESSASLHKQDISRTEDRLTASGDLWRYTYGSNNDLVASRVVNADGGPLEKRADLDEVQIRELSDGDRWENTFRDGRLIKMKLCYANGRTELFDGEGNAIG